MSQCFEDSFCEKSCLVRFHLVWLSSSNSLGGIASFSAKWKSRVKATVEGMAMPVDENTAENEDEDEEDKEEDKEEEEEEEVHMKHARLCQRT